MIERSLIEFISFMEDFMADTKKPDPKKPQPDPKTKPAANAPPKPAGGGYPPMK